MTELKARNGQLYVPTIFDCFNSSVIGLAIHTNQKAYLCVQTLVNASTAYPSLRELSTATRAHSIPARFTAMQLTNMESQSMNSAGGWYHNNARCESMCDRMKTELLYDRYQTEDITMDELKVPIWKYFIRYLNNRKICTANGGLPPMVKRQQY